MSVVVCGDPLEELKIQGYRGRALRPRRRVMGGLLAALLSFLARENLLQFYKNKRITSSTG